MVSALAQCLGNAIFGFERCFVLKLKYVDSNFANGIENKRNFRITLALRAFK